MRYTGGNGLVNSSVHYLGIGKLVVFTTLQIFYTNPGIMVKHKMLPASILLVPFNEFILTIVEVNGIAILKGGDAVEFDDPRRKTSHRPNNAINAPSILYMPGLQFSKDVFGEMDKLKPVLAGKDPRWTGTWKCRYNTHAIAALQVELMSEANIELFDYGELLLHVHGRPQSRLAVRVIFICNAVDIDTYPWTARQKRGRGHPSTMIFGPWARMANRGRFVVFLGQCLLCRISKSKSTIRAIFWIGCE
jgi:hypothetical protein